MSVSVSVLSLNTSLQHGYIYISIEIQVNYKLVLAIPHVVHSVKRPLPIHCVKTLVHSVHPSTLGHK